MCNYCEGNNFKRKNIMYDDNNSPIYVWNNKLFIDDGRDSDNEVTINFCPICGRKLD